MSNLTFYIIVANVVALIAFFVDKISAALPCKLPRISEQTLKGLILLGPFGSLLGMILFWHKIRKNDFWLMVLFCSILHGYCATEFLSQFYTFNINPAGMAHNTQKLHDWASKYIDINQQNAGSNTDFDGAINDIINQQNDEIQTHSEL